MIRKPTLYIFVLMSAILVSCGQYQKIVKSTDNELKYSKAVEYYEKKQYAKAQQLLEQVKPFFKGTDKDEKISYLIANTYYKRHDYILAGYHFKMFSGEFALSPFAEEAAYLSAYCNYLESPRSNLDQTNTLDAIASLSNFTKQYPNSKRVAEANKLIAELQAKLEKKAIDVAMLYYKMSDYKAAVVTLKNFLKDYPDSKSKEEVLYYLLQSKYQYAVNSIDEKKRERYADAKDAYDELIASFPTGSFATKAKNIGNEIAKVVKE